MLFQIFAAGLLLAQAPDPAALELVDRAIAQMGGRTALESIERIRYEMMTQWQRTTFDDRPYSDRPTYERHTDVRDYTINAWRNTRIFDRADTVMTVIDVVRGEAAIRDMCNGTAPAPLNVAYVDERDEIFAWTPERLLLHARAADDLRLLGDSTIGGMAHARLELTLNDSPAVLFLRRSDGLPALLRLRAAHPNDFGLVPLGMMDLEVWYSNWTTVPPGVNLPTQYDVTRGTRPYKRMTALHIEVNPTIAADAFAISDSLREAFHVTSTHPMHDRPIVNARSIEDRFIAFNTPGSPAGAVRVGDAWLLLGAGQAPLSAERAQAWMREHEAAQAAAVIVGNTALANGGIAYTTRNAIPTWVAPGFAELGAEIMRGYGTDARVLNVVTTGRWLAIGGDSVRVEPVDLPNARGALVVWVPSLHWMYAAAALTPLDEALVLGLARERGWHVDRLGTARAFPAAPPTVTPPAR